MKTVQELEIENAELRGQVAALKSVVEAFAKHQATWALPVGVQAGGMPLSLNAPMALPHNGVMCPSSCPGPHLCAVICDQVKVGS
jgi:hypothetical protein